MEIGGFDVTQVRRHDFEMFLRLIAGQTWTYNPVAGAVYNFMINPDAISSNKAEVHYYSIRGLLNNEATYGGGDMDRLLRDHWSMLLVNVRKFGCSAAYHNAAELMMSRMSKRDQLRSRIVAALAPHTSRLYRVGRRVLRG